MKGLLVQCKPWSKDKPLTNLLKRKSQTIRTFERMIDKRQFPSCVRNQCIIAMKCSQQDKLQFLNEQSVQQPHDLSGVDDKEREACTAHQSVAQFSDGKHHDKVVHGMTVDIGTNFDWSEMLHKEERDAPIDGTSWVDTIRTQHDSGTKDQAQAVDNLVIPTQRNGDAHDVGTLLDEQKSIMCDAMDTVMKFLANDPNCKTMRATAMGSGGAGKSFIINTIISMARTLTCSNDTVQIAVPS